VIFFLLFAGLIGFVCLRRRNGDQHSQRHHREKLGSLEMDIAPDQRSSGVMMQYDLYDPSTGMPEQQYLPSAIMKPPVRASFPLSLALASSSSYDSLYDQSTSAVPSSRKSFLAELRRVARQEAETVMREQRNEDSLPRYVSGVPGMR
jgi:hypothetical protein